MRGPSNLRYYACGICEQYHLSTYRDDCWDDTSRFNDVPIACIVTPAYDVERLSTRELVPYSAKVLAAKTKRLLSASAEYAPRSKSNANYAHQNLKQRYPDNLFTRQSPCLPFESGDNTLPGMEAFK
jgi:hypothetical protein